MTVRSYGEINARIRSGEVVVMTAEEAIDLVAAKGLAKAAAEVDVVTTGTFGPMCSSGAYFNFGHSRPRIKMQKVWLNEVPAYAGLAAVDAYLGATEVPEDDPLNSNFPGQFKYGGGHVIEDLVAGRKVRLQAESYGTDCYPRREIDTWFSLDDINEAVLFNPRNAYQNYNCAVNLGDRTIYTYMGILKARLGNAHYSTSGQLSPLLKDPAFRTIGLGTRIFLGGGIGYVAWQGTQHFPAVHSGANGREFGPAGGTLAVIGDLKQMSPRWLMGSSFTGYGATLTVGLGIPIPVLDSDVLRCATATDAELFAQIVDYSDAYPDRRAENLGFVSYAELKTGRITVRDREVPTAPVSSLPRAREIAATLKEWIQKGDFTLTEPAFTLPPAGRAAAARSLEIRGRE
ncbi:MAG: homocysteine biosynthesis protein [Peptococcaceae bacterium]|nr:homocysteine biosynthesis protein [Peptococcaceae bacterium]